MSEIPRPSRLDGPPGRIAAALVALAVLGILLRIHWSDFFPPDAELRDSPEYIACVEDRQAHIEGLLADGIFNEEQGEQLLQHARAECLTQVKNDS